MKFNTLVVITENTTTAAATITNNNNRRAEWIQKTSIPYFIVSLPPEEMGKRLFPTPRIWDPGWTGSACLCNCEKCKLSNLAFPSWGYEQISEEKLTLRDQTRNFKAFELKKSLEVIYNGMWLNGFEDMKNWPWNLTASRLWLRSFWHVT